MMEMTDESGVAVFKTEEGPGYSAHVLKVPEGYETQPAEFAADATYCDIPISLHKAP